MKRSRRNQKGTVLVEMAIVLPLFILILIGTMEFGIVLHDYQILQNASREGARFGTIGNSAASIEARVRSFAPQLTQGLVVQVTGDGGERGAELTVRATYPVPLVTALLREIVGANAFQLRAESHMRLE